MKGGKRSERAPDARARHLLAQLDTVMYADRHALSQRVRRANGAAGLEQIEAAIKASAERVEARARRVPNLTYPEELPVSAYREELLTAITQNQVVIVCGDTGSGKTTQLPKLCMEAGLGQRGFIAHTQPRRVAARSVAARLAYETGTEPGDAIGYKIRFSDRTHSDSLVKVVTDGMLLAEIQGDRFLSQYDTLILDEAHERSLNIDFLLGYLKWLLPKRPELKVIVTSATIDPESFARHFDDAPVVQVPGRTYPVEVRYRPLAGDDEEERDLGVADAVVEAVDEAASEGAGDILVFLPGEREIRESTEALRKHHPPHVEILPLYARLSAAEQDRVFKPGKGRRIVLATNVAETSLTVPGIRYVIDSGVARVSRYSHRSKVWRLPIEPVSRANADQRKGRCGRLGPGVCWRLYSEDDYEQRPEFTDPELARTNLASVILHMALLRLGDIEKFPFMEAPDPRYVRDGYRLLQDLGALDPHRKLTALGSKMARLPVDPRFARILLEAEHLGCVHEALPVVAALSIQDPRDRPQEKREAADAAHARFADPKSDFVALLKLWLHLAEQRSTLSHNKFRKYCKENFLSYVRVREWMEVHGQLKGMLAVKGTPAEEGDERYESLHRALLSGLIDHIGWRDEKGLYRGARNSRFKLHPANLIKASPRWVLAAELVETSQLFGRTAAAVEPQWIEAAAGERCKREYLEPAWDERGTRVVAREKVTLFGLTLSAGRQVDFGKVNADAARAIFIREGLVHGRLQPRPQFLIDNLARREELADIEDRTRRRDILVDEYAQEQFYAERLPEDVRDGPGLRRWLKREPGASAALEMAAADLRTDGGPADLDAFPESIEVGGQHYPLRYRFEPGHAEDGVMLSVPVAVLNQIPEAAPGWLVPGLLEERVIALMRGLPKPLRRNFVPVPDFARGALERMEHGNGNLIDALGQALKEMTGVGVQAQDWDEAALPAHLRMQVEVLDAAGEVMGRGRDLAALKARWAGEAKREFARAGRAAVVDVKSTCWDFGALAEAVAVARGGVSTTGYPALVDRKDHVSIEVFDNPDAARLAHRAGLRQLFVLGHRQEMRYLHKNLPELERMALAAHGTLNRNELVDDIAIAAVDRALGLDAGDAASIRDAGAFASRADAARRGLMPAAMDICRALGPALERYREVRAALEGELGDIHPRAAADIQRQLDGLIFPRFVSLTPRAWLERYPVYLQAVANRLERLRTGGSGRDIEAIKAMTPYIERIAGFSADEISGVDSLETYRWMLEEYRISLFAQELGTTVRVSPQRLDRQWEKCENSNR